MRILAWFALAVALPIPAQSLTEAAQKEKERRQKIRESGAPPAAVVSHTELAAGKGTLANDPNLPPAVPPPVAGAASPPTGSAPPGGAANRPGPTQEHSWRSRASAARARIEIAAGELAAARKEQEPLVVIHRQPGSSVAYDMTAAAKQAREQKIKRAEQALAAAERALSDLEDQARRANVPPGWLR